MVESQLANLKIEPEYYREMFTQWTSDEAMLPDFPSNQKELLVALHFVMMAFEECIDYSEEDIDEGIKDRNLFATDHVQIRLALLNNGYLSQITQGKYNSYRSARSFLQLADWDPTIPGVS